MQAGGVGHAAGSPELGDSSLGPISTQDLVSCLIWPHSPSLLCLSHI